jgi:dipeptidase E
MNLLLVSSSTVHGKGYLDHAIGDIRRIMGAAKTVLFVPFALKDHAAYAKQVRDRFAAESITVRSLHEEPSPIAAISAADAIFVGGGNTLVLLRELYDRQLLEPIRQAVLNGVPYIGSSAGANVAGVTVQTTNDMPIDFPPSLHALELVPFNINPHYRDRDPGSTFRGETREERIRQFHQYSGIAVLALREPAKAEILDQQLRILGGDARMFRAAKATTDIVKHDDFRPITEFVG